MPTFRSVLASVALVSIVVSLLVSVAIPAQAQSWVATGSMRVERVNHTATLLTDGRVLVTGGVTPAGTITPTAELYDPATATWTMTGSMSVGRSSHTTTLLKDGKVVVAGGQTPTETASSAELYDPATGTWTATGSMSYRRLAHTATVLTDGRVLIAGGEPPIYMTPTAELYDPATAIWTVTGSMSYARGRHTATLLADGRVLVAGGGAQWVPTTPTAELYDPAAGTWTATGSMSVERFAHTATLLTDGTVLVAGGGSNAASCADPFCFAPVPFATAEVFDLATGTWRPTGAMNDGRVAHTATMLTNGKVLVAGGALGCAPTPIGGAAGLFQLRSAEAYDSVTGTWVPLTLMQTGRSSHTATLRNDGSVLVAGGISATVTTAFIAEDGSISGECQAEFTGGAETYDPGPTPPPQPPVVSSLSLDRTSVTEGAASIGTVTLSAAAPPGGAVAELASSITAVATVPASVTVPAGATSATFTISTHAVAASIAVTISATYGGVTKSANLTVNPAITLLSLSLNPTIVTSGSSSSGTVTVSAPAPAGGAVVALSSNNSALAAVPITVTVATGATSATFTVSTNPPNACASSAATISATYGGVTKSAGLTMTPATDTVAVQQADYFASRHELRVAATSTGSAATLRVYATPTGQLIGTLKHYDGSRYSGRLTWSVNPQNITVRSSLCGSAMSAVRSR